MLGAPPARFNSLRLGKAEASPFCAAGDTAIVLGYYVCAWRRRVAFNAHDAELSLSFHLAAARQFSCSRWVLALRKNGAVSTSILSPHLGQDITEVAP